MQQKVVYLQIEKHETFNSDRKKINLIPNKSFRYNNLKSSIFLDAFVYS